MSSRTAQVGCEPQSSKSDNWIRDRCEPRGLSSSGTLAAVQTEEDRFTTCVNCEADFPSHPECPPVLWSDQTGEPQPRRFVRAAIPTRGHPEEQDLRWGVKSARFNASWFCSNGCHPCVSDLCPSSYTSLLTILLLGGYLIEGYSRLKISHFYFYKLEKIFFIFSNGVQARPPGELEASQEKFTRESDHHPQTVRKLLLRSGLTFTLYCISRDSCVFSLSAIFFTLLIPQSCGGLPLYLM